MNKKGSLELNQLVGIVVILIVVGILLIVGTSIESDMQKGIDTTTSTKTLMNVTTNHPVSHNVTGIYAGNVSIPNMRNCAMTLTSVTNATGNCGANIPASNYTINGCYVYYIGSEIHGDINSTLWNLTGTITYNVDTVEYNVAGDAMEGLGNVSEQQGLLGTIIVFGVIIGIVVVAFMMRS